MDSYTCVLYTRQCGQLLVRLLNRLLHELLAAQPAYSGTCHVAVVTHSGRYSRWHRVSSDPSVVPHLLDTDAREDSAARALHVLADRLPGTVTTSVLWCPDADQVPPSSTALYSALWRLRVCHNAVVSLLDESGATNLAVWRRLLVPTCQLQLRPTCVLRMHSSRDPRAPPSSGPGCPIYFNCDTAAWRELQRRIGAQCAGRLAICPRRGLDWIGPVRLSSVPVRFVQPFRASLEFIDERDFARWAPLLRWPDCAILARMYLIAVDSDCVVVVPAETASRRWHQKVSKAASSLPTGRSALRQWQQRLRELQEIPMAAVDEVFVCVHLLLRVQQEGFVSVRLLDGADRIGEDSTTAVAPLPADSNGIHRQWYRLAGADYVPCLSAAEWNTLLKRVDRSTTCSSLGGVSDHRASTVPREGEDDSDRLSARGGVCSLECCVCRQPTLTALNYWSRVHCVSSARPADPATIDPAGPHPQSVVLSADGILRVWRPSSSVWQVGGSAAADRGSVSAGGDPLWLRQAECTPWPAALGLHCHGVYYNHGVEQEAVDRRACRLRDRVVGHQTASTCSVWRSDAVTVRTGVDAECDRRKRRHRCVTTVSSNARALRRSPRKHAAKLNGEHTQSVPSPLSTASVSDSVAGSSCSTAGVPPCSELVSSRQQLRRSPRKRLPAAGGGQEQISPRRPGRNSSRSSLSAAVKQKLRSVVYVALGEVGVAPRDKLFRPSACRLYTIVRAYVDRPKDSVSSRQLLKYARPHAQLVVDIERRLKTSS